MLKLKNPFIMAPVKAGYSNGTGVFTEKHFHFYAARAKHLGAISPEPLYIDKGLRELPTQLGIDDDSKIEGLKRFTEMLHSHDTKAIAHLNHPGRMANPMIPNNYFVSSSDKACEAGGAKPTRLGTGADKQKVIDLFVQAAVRAEKANFDFVELQFGHGYLVAQFISQKVNDRTDTYGGSFKNRTRLAFDILAAVKKAIQIPVIIRISGDEMLPDGIKLDEMKQFAKLLADKGAAAIHVSAGTVCSTPPWYFQHMFVPKGKTWQLAAEIKKVIDIPVIFVGQINTSEDIDRLRNEFKADYLAIGRPMLADPDFVGKYLDLVDGQIRPCLACSDGCLGGVKSGKGVGCMVNPTVGKENILLTKTNDSKHYAIVGGGLAGMETAITLTKRGHQATIYEKNVLGGQFNLAYLPPKKESLKKIVDFYVQEIKSQQIPVITQEATANDLDGKYDGVILASGSVPTIPPIDGLKKYFWAEVLENQNMPTAKRVVVIGGGLIGVEVAHKLEKKGNKVSIIEMLDEVARGMEMIEKKLTMASFKNSDVDIFLNTKVTKIDTDTVFIENENMRSSIEQVDLIVLATGMRAYAPLLEQIKQTPVMLVGDAKQVAKAQNAIADGYELAANL